MSFDGMACEVEIYSPSGILLHKKPLEWVKHKMRKGKLIPFSPHECMLNGVPLKVMVVKGEKLNSSLKPK